MSEAFRDISGRAGATADYQRPVCRVRHPLRRLFSRDAEVELTEWYLPPQGLFIVLERDGEIIATGAYKPKRSRTPRKLSGSGRIVGCVNRVAGEVVQELERRAVLAGYSHIYLTTGFRQPEAVSSI